MSGRIFIFIALLLVAATALASSMYSSADISLWAQNAHTCTLKYVCKSAVLPSRSPPLHKNPRHRHVTPSAAANTVVVHNGQLLDDPGYRKLIDPTGTGTPNLYNTYPTPAETFESQIEHNNLSHDIVPCACKCKDPFNQYGNPYVGNYRIIDIYVVHLYNSDRTIHSSSSNTSSVNVAEPPALLLLCTGLLLLCIVRLKLIIN